MSAASQPLLVNCPNCQRSVEWTPANLFRPFCSERCKLIDLGAWATESYAVPAEPTLGDEFPTPPQH